MRIATPVGAFDIPADGAAIAYPESDGVIFVYLPKSRQWAMCNGHTRRVTLLPFLTK